MRSPIFVIRTPTVNIIDSLPIEIIFGNHVAKDIRLQEDSLQREKANLGTAAHRKQDAVCFFESMLFEGTKCLPPDWIINCHALTTGQLSNSVNQRSSSCAGKPTTTVRVFVTQSACIWKIFFSASEICSCVTLNHHTDVANKNYLSGKNEARREGKMQNTCEEENIVNINSRIKKWCSTRRKHWKGVERDSAVACWERRWECTIRQPTPATRTRVFTFKCALLFQPVVPYRIISLQE